VDRAVFPFAERDVDRAVFPFADLAEGIDDALPFFPPALLQAFLSAFLPALFPETFDFRRYQQHHTTQYL
jgi:hypothetical protein